MVLSGPSQGDAGWSATEGVSPGLAMELLGGPAAAAVVGRVHDDVVEGLAVAVLVPGLPDVATGDGHGAFRAARDGQGGFLADRADHGLRRLGLGDAHNAGGYLAGHQHHAPALPVLERGIDGDTVIGISAVRAGEGGGLKASVECAHALRAAGRERLSRLAYRADDDLYRGHWGLGRWVRLGEGHPAGRGGTDKRRSHDTGDQTLLSA